MRGLRGLAAVALACVCLAPFLWQVQTSLRPPEQVMSLPPLLPTELSGTHYRRVFEGRPFARYLVNSAVVSALATAIALVLGAPAAYALARLRFRGREALLLSLLAISMFPPIATISPLYLAARALGLRDTHAALVLPYAAFALPLAVWTLVASFRDVPEELLRAAQVDGCTHAQAFRKVVLPVAAPGLATAAILTFVFAWNELLIALTLTATERSRTVPVGIALFPGLHEVPWGEIAAASVIVTAPLVLLAAVLQRRIVAGLTAGAVKG